MEIIKKQADVVTFADCNNKKAFDMHSHTYYSNCSEDNPHDLIKTAITGGISLLGINDHSYGIGNRKEEYYKEIRALANEYKDKIKILCGIEIPTLFGVEEMIKPEEIKNFDYCLIEHITYENSFVKEKLFGFCDFLGIRCGIAHTDLFEYCDMYGFDYVKFFGEMAKRGIFWEMNVNYDSIHKYREHKYVSDFMNDKKKMEIVKNAGVYISVGFDSHRYPDYDENRVHKMYDFLKENSFKTADMLFC